jgi:hypothetical protein
MDSGCLLILQPILVNFAIKSFKAACSANLGPQELNVLFVISLISMPGLVQLNVANVKTNRING